MVLTFKAVYFIILICCESKSNYFLNINQFALLDFIESD